MATSKCPKSEAKLHPCRPRRDFALPSALDRSSFRENALRTIGPGRAAIGALLPRGGPLAGTPPAWRADRDRAVARRHPGDPERMVQSFLQHLAGSQFQRLRQRHPVLLRDRGDLHRARSVPELPEPLAADPLAALDDADLSAAMAG